ncbi:uncharacterized protein LOC110012582 [Sesamum indicum]|uniref:Uncharacterized protein LOC110012582 n=1 Tax=Sesamum indicum TaxID=4182 RepID=A0A8M8V7A8_SESIN|nr:uncharacterized protein LOC110012582 [Sesamum indicum]
MQRQSSNSRPTDPPQIPQSRAMFFQRRRAERGPILPLHNKENLGLRSSEVAVHFIPILVLSCLFILWWFSHPVKLEMKTGRLAATYQIAVQDTPSNLTDEVLTVPPYPWISEVQMASNESTAESARTEGETV